MTYKISPSARRQFFDANGNPLIGGKLFHYLNKTTTKSATKTTILGDANNTNPIILDADGRTPFGVWLDSDITYTEVLAYATDSDPPTSPIYTENDIVLSDITPTAPSVIYGFVNKLINGNFLINQRGVSGTVTLAAGAYGHDRFKAGSGGCTYTFVTINNVTTLTIAAGTLMQVIEGANLQSGIHSLSWVGSSQGRIDSGAYENSGVTGMAIGGTDQTCEWGTGTLSKVQYQEGSTVTEFERRFNAFEKLLCQRYFLKYRFQGFALDAYSLIVTSQFPVEMRAAPTITGFPGSIRNTITGVVKAPTNPVAPNTHTLGIYYFSATSWTPGLTPGNAYDAIGVSGEFSASAEL